MKTNDQSEPVVIVVNGRRLWRYAVAYRYGDGIGYFHTYASDRRVARVRAERILGAGRVLDVRRCANLRAVFRVWLNGGKTEKPAVRVKECHRLLLTDELKRFGMREAISRRWLLMWTLVFAAGGMGCLAGLMDSALCAWAAVIEWIGAMGVYVWAYTAEQKLRRMS